jgi:hypothetical protein
VAIKFTSPPVIGTPEEVHATAQNHLGMEAKDDLGRTWVYLMFVGNMANGSWVSYDEDRATLLAANAIGPVAVAGATGLAGQFGWFCVIARNGVMARLAAGCADNARLGREAADGVVGDGRLAGDEIYNAISRGATTGAALGLVQICNPYVDDVNGA